MLNRLKEEYSPYLKKHANNPIDWYPWCDEAFEKAKELNRPIFLSIGYSSCHWCHIMEKESFEDKEISSFLNENFISIKVDKEERPDIDKHFEEVFQALNNRLSGWPLSFFLTEDQKPFFATTYIPIDEKEGMQDFLTILKQIEKTYKNEKDSLLKKGERALDAIKVDYNSIKATKLDLSIVQRFSNQAKELFDDVNGGFSKESKFPQTSILDLLLDIYLIQRDEELLKMVKTTLFHMAKGGLRDIVGGGFFRYSLDEKWLIPHFEKMTYNNALISSIYLRVFNITGEIFYKNIAFEIITFMQENMSEKSLFFTAIDSDIDDEEGKYFVFTNQDILDAFNNADIPTDEQVRLAEALGVTRDGNFNEKNIIRLKDPIKAHTTILYYYKALNGLKELRKKRTTPFMDRKIITSWNAMMITTLFKASRVDNFYLGLAMQSLEQLLERMYIGDRLYHSTLGIENPKIVGFLEDYAYVCEMLIEAYNSTLDESYLNLTIKLVNDAIELFYRDGEWQFTTTNFQTTASIYDDSYPSSVGKILWVIYTISSFKDVVYKKFIFKTLEFYSYKLMRKPITMPMMTRLVIRYLKDDLLIRASKKNLKEHINKQDSLSYPYSYLKIDINEGFMLCSLQNCYAHKEDFDTIVETLKTLR